MSHDSGLNSHLVFGLTPRSGQLKALAGHRKALVFLPSPLDKGSPNYSGIFTEGTQALGVSGPRHTSTTAGWV